MIKPLSGSHSHPGRWLWLVIGSMILSGCMIGPDPTRPATGLTHDSRFAATGPAAGAQGTDMLQWWERFDDPQTNQLVALALANNQDLQVAAARLKQAQGALEAGFGQLMPQVEVGASAARSRVYQQTLLGAGPAYSTSLNLPTVQVSWVLDVWGQVRRGYQALEYDYLSARAAHQAVMHAVIAEVVKARVDIAILQRNLAMMQANAKSLNKTLAIVRQRRRRGLASAIEVKLAQENAARAMASIPEAEQLLKLARLRLDVLIGRQPNTGEIPDDDLAVLPGFDPPPAGLPIQLLSRRPDLRQTEFAQAAQTARIGVAIGNFLPNVTVLAGGGVTGDDVTNMFDVDHLVGQLVGQTAWKIFTWGKHAGELKVAEARAEAATAAYRQKILQAIAEVESALIRETLLRKRYAVLQEALAYAETAEKLSRDRFALGQLDSLLPVLEAERRRLNTQINLLLAQQDIWSTRVDLYLALGGDWLVRAKTPGDQSPVMLLATTQPAPLTEQAEHQQEESER